MEIKRDFVKHGLRIEVNLLKTIFKFSFPWFFYFLEAGKHLWDGKYDKNGERENMDKIWFKFICRIILNNIIFGNKISYTQMLSLSRKLGVNFSHMTSKLEELIVLIWMLLMFRSLEIITNKHNPIFAFAVERNYLTCIVKFAVENSFDDNEEYIYNCVENTLPVWILWTICI